MEFPKQKQERSQKNYGRSTILLIIYLLISIFKWITYTCLPPGSSALT